MGASKGSFSCLAMVGALILGAICVGIFPLASVRCSVAENTNVHTRHCCKNCGCKYGQDVPDWRDDDGWIECDVVAGQMEQEYPCGQTSVCWDYCEDEWD